MRNTIVCVHERRGEGDEMPERRDERRDRRDERRWRRRADKRGERRGDPEREGEREWVEKGKGTTTSKRVQVGIYTFRTVADASRATRPRPPFNKPVAFVVPESPARQLELIDWRS